MSGHGLDRGPSYLPRHARCAYGSGKGAVLDAMRRECWCANPMQLPMLMNADVIDCSVVGVEFDEEHLANGGV